MNKLLFSLIVVCSSSILFAQNSKIQLIPGQVIIVENSVNIEASLSMGMELNSSSTTQNTLTVKTVTDNNFIISNSLTKLIINMSMMGQNTNYDSENKNAGSTEVTQALEKKMNKPVDINIDSKTGKQILNKEKIKNVTSDDENPMMGLMNMFAESTDEAIVTGAIELIPIGKTIGDKWADTSKSKDLKTIRTFTLLSISGNEAIIQIEAQTTALNKIEMQGMEIEFKSNSKTKSEITTNTSTGLVQKRNSTTDVTGSFQLMGQDVPISSKSTSKITYK